MRSPEDFCLLCRINKATQTNSHFTSAGLIRTSIGPRDKEEAYSIDINELTSDVFYGRANLKNESEQVSPNPHSMDFIFCPDCERKLGQLESEFIPFLNEKMRLKKYESQFSISHRDTRLFCKETKTIDPLKFGIFILSIVWRQCIEVILDGNPIVLKDTYTEQIRKAIYKYLENPDQSVIEDLKKYIPGFAIVTTDFPSYKESLNFINPYPTSMNPEIFLVNDFTILLLKGMDAPTDFTSQGNVAGLPLEILNSDFLNTFDNDVKIVFVEYKDWGSHLTHFMRTAYAQTMELATKRISKARCVPQFIAKILLAKKMQGISPGPEYMNHFKKAVDELLVGKLF